MVEFIIIQILFILILFLRELGITTLIYEEIITNPKTKPILKLLGDVLYMVGGSIIGAVVYTFYTSTIGFEILPFMVGLIFVGYGAYLRDIKGKK
jgi:hypothetical protein